MIMQQLFENKKKKVIVRIGLCFLVIVALIVSVYFYFSSKQEYDTRFVNGEIETTNLHDLKEKLQAQSDASKVSIQCNTEPVFTNGGVQGNLFFSNNASNQYIARITITLTSDDKQVYASDDIKPGSTLSSQGLQVELTEGSYEAIAKVDFYDDNHELSTTNLIDMILHVK